MDYFYNIFMKREIFGGMDSYFCELSLWTFSLQLCNKLDIYKYIIEL